MIYSKRKYIKALETIVYLSERDQRNYWILKAIYFADKEHLKRYGRQLFGEYYRAMKQGPVPSLAYDIVKCARGSGFYKFTDPDPASAIYVPDKYTIAPKRAANTDYLSKSEIECLDFALELVKPLDFDKLKELSHDSAYNAVQQDEEMTLESIINSLDNCTEIMEYMHAAQEGFISLVGNSLSSSSKKALIRAKIKPGSIIHIFCDFIRDPKNKFCVIVHADFEEDYLLFFLVNSEIPPFIQKNEAMNRCQLVLKQEDYSFFSKPVSHLNCAELHDDLDVEFVIDHLLSIPEDYKGMLLDKEIEEIIQIVNETKTIGDYDKNLIFNSLGN